MLFLTLKHGPFPGLKALVSPRSMNDMNDQLSQHRTIMLCIQSTYPYTKVYLKAKYIILMQYVRLTVQAGGELGTNSFFQALGTSLFWDNNIYLLNQKNTPIERCCLLKNFINPLLTFSRNSTH